MSIPSDVKEVFAHDRSTEKDHGLDWSILVMYRGSIAHGMYCPPSDPASIDDKDIMEVCVPPIDYYLGLSQYGSHGTKEFKRNEWDVVSYELRKYMSLLAQGNPNVLMTLWMEQKYYLKLTAAGQLIRTHRTIFNGKHAYRAFSGYAKGQMHRMTHHGDFSGHMGDKRKKLVEQFGYDTKNASHLIRLLRMGVEFLTEGVLYVERAHDATELLEIKKGEWSLERVQKEADRWFQLIDETYVKSTLPNHPDMVAINQLCVDVAETAIFDRNPDMGCDY